MNLNFYCPSLQLQTYPNNHHFEWLKTGPATDSKCTFMWHFKKLTVLNPWKHILHSNKPLTACIRLWTAALLVFINVIGQNPQEYGRSPVCTPIWLRYPFLVKNVASQYSQCTFRAWASPWLRRCVLIVLFWRNRFPHISQDHFILSGSSGRWINSCRRNWVVSMNVRGHKSHLNLLQLETRRILLELNSIAGNYLFALN